MSEIPHQIADALWRIEAAGVPRREHRVRVGGAAFNAGELTAEILRGRESAADAPELVLIASYSGDDEEALKCFEDESDAQRVVICTAGELAKRAREEGVPVIGVPAGFDDPREALLYYVLAAFVLSAPELQPDADLLGRLLT